MRATSSSRTVSQGQTSHIPLVKKKKKKMVTVPFMKSSWNLSLHHEPDREVTPPQEVGP